MLGISSRSGTGRKPAARRRWARRSGASGGGARSSATALHAQLWRNCARRAAAPNSAITVSPATPALSRPTTICAPAGQIDVDARAEADEAEPVAGGQMRALVGEADDAARDQAGDLHHAERPGGVSITTPLRSLSSLALSRSALRNSAGMVGDPLDPPLDRRAVHVAVEHRHEDRDPLQRPRRRGRVRAAARRAGEADHAVRRRDDEVGAQRRHARRIAEEIGAPQRRDQADPAERRPEPAENQRRRRRSRRRKSSPRDGSARAGREWISMTDMRDSRREAGLMAPNRRKSHGGWPAMPATSASVDVLRGPPRPPRSARRPAQRLLGRVDLALAAPQRRRRFRPRASSSSWRAALGDDALVEHQDLVGVDDGRQPVRDDDRRAALARPAPAPPGSRAR